METVAGDRLVRPCDDRHARFVESPHHPEVFSVVGGSPTNNIITCYHYH
jgi:hypothetical protein